MVVNQTKEYKKSVDEIAEVLGIAKSTINSFYELISPFKNSLIPESCKLWECKWLYKIFIL